MFQKIKESNLIQSLRLKIDDKMMWIYPLGHMIIAVILAYIVIHFDIRGHIAYEDLPRIFLTSVSLARTILGALTSSLLTITTFTFSTIITVLTLYSSNFSPRIVENFLKEKLSLKVLGMFLGGFFYSITSLLFMRDALESDLVISATIGVIYAALCSIYFVRFIYKVSTSVQTSYVINDLIEQADSVVEQLKENEDEEIQFLHTIQFDEDSARPIRAKQTGYVQLVGHDTIFNRLEDEDVQIFLKVRPGDFVVEGQTIASIIEKEEHRLLLPQEDSEDSEDIEVDSFVNQHITIQDVRNESYDYRYSIQKVEEVAIRALSPGVNDPYTAVQCVNTMSELIRKLASYDAGYFILKEDERPATVFYTSIAFEEDIYDFFREIILYGVGDLEVVHALFDGYKSISSNASKANLEAIRTVAQYTYDKAIENYTHTLDIKGIQKDFHHLMDFIASKEKSVES